MPASVDKGVNHKGQQYKTDEYRQESEALEKERVRARRDVDAAAAKITLAAPALAVFTRTMEGSPTDGILHEAKEWGADLIIMGSHGQNAALRILLGSVAHAVAQNAPCSVEVVRTPQTEAAHAA